MKNRKSKTVKNYCYEGLGFPVILKKVTMIEFDCEFLPQIHVKKVSDEVIKLLSLSPEKFTGSQLKFIRQYLSMTTREFAKEILGSDTCSNISKWESRKEKPTKMEEGTELIIRLYVIENVIEAKKSNHSKFFELYKKAKVFLKSTGKKQALCLDETFA
mgnify:CR=1 FL=1|tara:strand:+ start:322 stop:798 length:477 start_codon:yes stop_codon:yes gene_type:complete